MLEKSGREDLNLRPPRPERGALPGCATSRLCRLLYQLGFRLQVSGLSEEPHTRRPLRYQSVPGVSPSRLTSADTGSAMPLPDAYTAMKAVSRPAYSSRAPAMASATVAG